MAGVRALQDGVFRCLCPAGSVLAADGLSCVPASGWSSPSDGTVNFSFFVVVVGGGGGGGGVAFHRLVVLY